ncbi:TPA: tRNA (adenosine(37)-N6)-threonylcarbamoyltransferase complex transferase subunit TsaD [Candidatus Wolfebacteria bacterium]|nr:tRNA (adenosine(37)-N6)-threonylcarbamoyltransferase complex transferase subunit TsaD [Candidatus Wolfebacteria bacterium]HBD17750.1 tRNA (adenosine(37)-N6)-threonylcarbamoyltransferase complex transferase subunit TsaD [Candidatus Wolfebacteria bacterium]HBN87321.1 tRNA (adenosine(37)-N6)-threonylcarbamoyltransferase complex transferase subunit TsaD [Candidatus Wolfebacteria bacterium]HBT75280.1 tRNA (adenosine(37)-N6)-threonylcarbamoyltransferase complex transferase subunit TsaD [Candidatus 
MNILSIETSCDETALSFVTASGGLEKPTFTVHGDVVASQIKLHQPYGGVVPALAKRAHLENLPLLFAQVVRGGVTPAEAGVQEGLDSGLRRNDNSEISAQEVEQFMEQLDFITVTVGPGLEPALWAGIEFAKQLAEKHSKPLIGTNHLEGHLYSILVSTKQYDVASIFPAIALIVSGGHTLLLKMDDLTTFKKIGETVDDAVGEAFDKVARMIDLPYPGGPEIERLAKEGNAMAIDFPRPMIGHKNYNFSFSGLKTSVLYHLRDLAKAGKEIPKADVAASFQKAASDVLIKKTLRAAEEFDAKSIMISGGVSANRTLRASFADAIEKKFKAKKDKPILIVSEFSTDNALMIAASGYIDYLRGKKYKLEANGNLNL